MVGMMKKLNQFIDEKINKILIVFLLISPFLDLVTSLFLNVFRLEFNLILIVKGLFLVFLLYYYFVINKKKDKWGLISLVLIFIYLLFNFIFLIISKSEIILYELKNNFRVFFFPIVLIIIYQLYIDKKLKIDLKYLIYVLVMYLILLFIPLITNLGFNSYAYSKVGSIGWFNSTNEIGGIISILLPLLIYQILEMKNIVYKLLSIGLILYVYTAIGSKVPTIALIIVLFVTVLLYMCKWVVNKEIVKLIGGFIGTLIVCFSLLIIIPKTSFYKNIKIHTKFLGIDSVGDLVNIKNVDRFIFSDRISFMEKTMNNYQKADLASKLLGIGYIENYGTDDVNIKLIEMDYYDIIFRHGIIGSIVYFTPLILIITKKRLTKRFDIYNLYLFISVIMIFILALFSGHIFVSPSVSYIVVVLVMKWLESKEVLDENRNNFG